MKQKEAVKPFMRTTESFGECLQRVLAQVGVSASEAARLVGFRSRNSIFRILAGSTSCDVDARFLTALRQAVGEEWPEEHWDALERALSIKRVGRVQYLSNQAFSSALQAGAQTADFIAETARDGRMEETSLRALLTELCAEAELSVVMCGCCDRDLTALLAQTLGEAGEAGRLRICHYIDVRLEAMVENLLGVLPLVGKVWYNARLVDQGDCPEEMEALYRTNIICIRRTGADGHAAWHQLLRCDAQRFVHIAAQGEENPIVSILHRCRYQMEALKPLTPPTGGPLAFVEYTAQYEQLERDGMILSIKPDIHFNCVPSELLYQSVMDGFEQAGLASGPELQELVEKLREIHDARYRNMTRKRRATHLVYSIPAMERFMRTGVQTDHFFIQRPYTPEERREIVRLLYRQTLEDPYFHIHFLREDQPPLRYEMTSYQDKGVLLMDAHTGYALHDDHSEALITLPLFMQSFQRFFMDELLARHVLSGAETHAVFERLLKI